MAIDSARNASVHSLRGRLFGTLLGIVICAWVVVGIYVYVQFAQARSGLTDRDLNEVASLVLLSMPSNIGHFSSGSNLSLKDAMPPHAKLDRSIQAWSKARHELVLRSAGAPSMLLKADFADGFGTAQLAGEEWRVLSAGPGVTFANQEYMQTFFGVTSAQATRSVLAPYTPASGVSFVNVSVGATYLLSSRWFLGAHATAARLQGDAADSPIIADKNQNLYALFFGYRF
jgi:hypothetical protein